MEKIIAYFEENKNIFNTCLEELDDYNGYLGDDRYYEMSELDDVLYDKSATDILNMAFFGHDEDEWTTNAYGEIEYAPFNPNRWHFRFNGYGNLISSDEIDYSAHLDEYAIEAMSENRRYIDTIEVYDKLVELFDEL